MKFTKTVVTLLLVCFVFGANVGVSRAQEPIIAESNGLSKDGATEIEDVLTKPQPEITDKEVVLLLEKDPKSVTESDLTMRAHIILQEKVTAEQLFEFHDRLSPEQQKFVQTTFLEIIKYILGKRA